MITQQCFTFRGRKWAVGKTLRKKGMPDTEGGDLDPTLPQPPPQVLSNVTTVHTLNNVF